MTKRLFVALLVACVIAGTASSAFAAGFSDTGGTRYANAVGVLSSIGVLNGFPDGTFRPGATITRAQFAAASVRALGLDAAAAQSRGPTRFTDVPATHWASGYINVASDQALIIMGYPDGTFRPEAPLTYVQSLAIIVRMLGHEPMVKGAWPTNYIVKAAEIGASEGLTFLADDPAPRGDVALMLENSLDIGLLVQVTAGDVVTYEVSGETLLDKLGFVAGEGRVTATSNLFDAGLVDNEVGLDGDVWTLTDGLNVDALLGMDVRYWFDASDTILFMKGLTGPRDIVSGEIQHIATDGGQVEIGDETYNGSAGFACVRNLTDFDCAAIANNDPRFEGAGATLILDGGRVAFLGALQFDGSVVVSDVSTRFGRLDTWNNIGGDLRFEVADYDAARFVRDGAQIELGDIEELDVAHFFDIAVGGRDYLYVELVDEKVAGEVDAVELDADDNIIVTIDGDEYTLAGDATLSTDDNGTLAGADEAGMEEFAGGDATVYLNRDGEARHVVGDFDVEATAVAGVVKTEFYKVAAAEPGDAEHFFVRVFKADGGTVRYEFSADTVFFALDDVNDGAAVLDGDGLASDAGVIALNNDLEIGTYVEFTLDDDGLLGTFEEKDFDDDSVGLGLDAADVDADHDLLFDEWRAVTGMLIVDVGEWDIVPWSAFEEITIGAGPVNGVNIDHGGDATAETLIFDSTGHGVDYGAAIAEVGVVLSRKVTSDGTAVKVLVADEAATYLAGAVVPGALDASNEGAATAAWDDIDIGDLVSFAYDVDEFAALDEELAVKAFAGLYSYWVESVNEDDRVVVVRDSEDPDGASVTDLLLDNECVIYDVTGTPVEADLGDLADGQVVQAFDLDGDDLIDVIKIAE